jgi:aminoglycoside phosphotransferase family enzyme/predicted kinase
VNIQATEGPKAGAQNQDAVVRAMMDPAVYPKRPPEVTHKETHISHLFFAGELVYKIKKAVRYSFLDYSTLGKRRHFLTEELRLNRRLAPSVYLAITPIITDGAHWELGGDGEPVEYALVMRRLPEKRMLPFLLETNQVTAAMLSELAEILAKFHSRSERIVPGDPSDYPKAVEEEWNDNLTDLDPFAGTLIEAETLAALKDFGTRFVQRHHDLLISRAKQGWIRDVHGDLHCEHVCFAPEGIQIFDCIEFSSKLRCCDLASEIAFLLMDLEARGGASLVEPFLTRYGELLPDPDLAIFLPFYKCYRAVVRSKVHALRGNADAARRYFRFATRFTREFQKPLLVIVCGLTGSGKSTLARELGERLGVPVINSDAVRKAMAGKSGRQSVPFNAGIYHPAMTEKTYAKMARDAERQIRNGGGAILDATFGQKRHRAKLIRLAQKHGVRLFVIHCVATEETTKKRLAQRALEGKDISDGRWEIYVQQAAAYQPLDEIPAADRLELNTEGSLEQLARASEEFLRSRCDRGLP